MSVSVKIELDGLDKLLADLQRLGAAGEEVVEDTITDLVLDTHQKAVDGIQRGPKTGTIYYRIYDPETGWTNIYAGDSEGYITSIKGPANLSPTHQASESGQYPATDTGRLASNVRYELPQGGNMVGRVGTNIQYGAYLEFGTSQMDARPWLLPSFEKAKVGVTKELKAKLEGRI